MADLDYEGFWKETLIQLQNDLGGEEFSGWFSDTKYLRAGFDEQTKENSIVIGIPSSFHRDKVKSRYQSTINSKIKELAGLEIAVEFEITGETSKKEPSVQQLPSKNDNLTIIEPKNTQITKKKRDKHPQMRDDFTFERYVIGENNSFAANAAIAISNNPGKAYNPFLIYGGVGLGKTHLMQAIGNHIHENTDNKVIYTTSENFLNEYVQAIQDGKMNIFKNKFRYTDVLLIDDIQFFTDKQGVQEELFHTFNALANSKKQLIFTCDRPPSELKKFSDRLISRFEQGLKADLQPPRYEERCAILKSTIKNRDVEISDEIIDFIGKNISSNVRDIIAALNTLIAYTELMGRPITLEIAQQRLKDYFSSSRQANLSMDNIIRVVAEYFALTPNDLKGKKRSQNIVSARQLAMFLGREMTDYSTTELGQDFGGRDHTTVMYSIDRIKGKLLTDPTLDSTIERIKRSIKEFSAKY
ncbi:MAG: chromosomal replication initiator protein DnaA [Treponema sp.]|nr:chromosomal replication initiator protein DnaA [Treponema sp.]MCL2272739.1 chromosomal replication initiator protein DnaA [Treponema sp.]